MNYINLFRTNELISRLHTSSNYWKRDFPGFLLKMGHVHKLSYDDLKSLDWIACINIGPYLLSLYYNLNKFLQSMALQEHTGYKPDELKDCVLRLQALLLGSETSARAIHQKVSQIIISFFLFQMGIIMNYVNLIYIPRFFLGTVQTCCLNVSTRWYSWILFQGFRCMNFWDLLKDISINWKNVLRRMSDLSNSFI